jgi:beta-mannanase
MVNAFRAIPGTDFKFDYNINAGDNNNVSGRSTFDSYPGNAYVDYIGIDIYDWYGTLTSFQANLTEAANFAQVMQLPLTIPEWGLANNEDDPAFVNLIHSNCDTSSCYEEGLFSGLSSGPGTSIVNQAASLAAYVADFG